MYPIRRKSFRGPSEGYPIHGTNSSRHPQEDPSRGPVHGTLPRGHNPEDPPGGHSGGHLQGLQPGDYLKRTPPRDPSRVPLQGNQLWGTPREANVGDRLQGTPSTEHYLEDHTRGPPNSSPFRVPLNISPSRGTLQGTYTSVLPPEDPHEHNSLHGTPSGGPHTEDPPRGLHTSLFF
jgi:hypothetical protein